MKLADISNCILSINLDDINLIDGSTISGLIDKSGNGNNVTIGISSPVFYNNKINYKKSLYFNGTNQLLVNNLSSIGYKNMTYVLVISNPSTQNDQGVIIGKDVSGYTSAVALYSKPNGSIDLTSAGAISGELNSTYALTNVPSIIICSIDSSGVGNMYIQNKLVSNTIFGTTSTPNTPFQIGNRPSGNRGYIGYISEIALYNKVLSTDEISLVYTTLYNKYICLSEFLIQDGNNLCNTLGADLNIKGILPYTTDVFNNYGIKDLSKVSKTSISLIGNEKYNMGMLK